MSDIADQQEINRLNALVEALVRQRDALAINCESIMKHASKRAEAAEDEVERLKGVLGAVNGYMTNACICMAAGGTKASATDILNRAVDIARSALEAKP